MSGRFASRRAQLLEYAPWILRDYFTNQGPSTALVVLLVGYLTVLPVLHSPPAAGVAVGDVPVDMARRILHAIVPALVFLGTFFATNGIVANDRKMGYYRFLFAKPVSPPMYYATTFVLYGVGLATVTLVLLGIWALTVRPMFPSELFMIIALIYLAYGGIGFLLSAAWRFDWLSLVTVLFLSNVAWSLWSESSGLKHWLLYLLPPVHRAADVYTLILPAHGATPWASIAWLAGYGVVCFVLGMYVIRRRPLGT